MPRLPLSKHSVTAAFSSARANLDFPIHIALVYSGNNVFAFQIERH